MLDVALLGSGGTMPLPNRFLTSLMCRLNGKYLLIDCGEGTQVSIKMLGWGFKNIDVICLTHFHADHVVGLPGILLTIGNSGRVEPITIIGPKGVKTVVQSLCIVAREIPFEINFIELDEVNDDIRIGEFIISTYQMEHKITCFSYSIKINRKPKFIPDKAKKLNIPKVFWSNLQNNETICHDNTIYTSDMVMGELRKGIKVSYCTDSRPVDGFSEFVANSNLFICEGLYGDDNKKEQAKKYFHMVFSEAATIAKNGNVNELWLTHFSPSLVTPEDFLNVATDIFENTVIGQDRMTKTILFE